jgi:hypothetical protein
MSAVSIAQQRLDNAKIYGSREGMIDDFKLRGLIAEKPAVVEVGVGVGAWSLKLINTLQPSEFVGIDNFLMHQYDECWGTKTSELLEGKTHKNFYTDLLKPYATTATIRIEEALSHDGLALLPDASFDLIYLDADHSYDAIKRDAEQAFLKIKPNGMIIFNDYLMYDHISHSPYGVVQVANQEIMDRKLDVLGFSFDRSMFCDLAVRC